MKMKKSISLAALSALALAGCTHEAVKPAPTNEAPVVPTNIQPTEAEPATTPTTETTPTQPTQPIKYPNLYKDGSYSATGSYISPGGTEQVGVTLTIKDDVIIASEFEMMAERPISVKMQEMFADNYIGEVVGVNLTSLNLGKVSGSSLTPIGFNDAVVKIRAQALIQ